MKTNNFKKIALFSAAMFATLPAYAISPAGAAGATAGALVGAYVVGKVISNNQKDKNECKPCKSDKKVKSFQPDSTQSKKAMKDDLKEYKRKRAEHQRNLKHVEKRTDQLSVAETARHKGAISELEAMIDDLEQRIKKAV